MKKIFSEKLQECFIFFDIFRIIDICIPPRDVREGMQSYPGENGDLSNPEIALHFF